MQHRNAAEAIMLLPDARENRLPGDLSFKDQFTAGSLPHVHVQGSAPGAVQAQKRIGRHKQQNLDFVVLRIPVHKFAQDMQVLVCVGYIVGVLYTARLVHKGNDEAQGSALVARGGFGRTLHRLRNPPHLHRHGLSVKREPGHLVLQFIPLVHVLDNHDIHRGHVHEHDNGHHGLNVQLLHSRSTHHSYISRLVRLSLLDGLNGLVKCTEHVLEGLKVQPDVLLCRKV